MARSPDRFDYSRFVQAPLLERSPKPLQKQSALVTGFRPNGVGFAIAERFAHDGAQVIIVGTENSRDIAPFVIARLKRYGVNIHSLVGDIGDEKSCGEIMQQAYELCGGNIDILVNNAGVNRNREFSQITTEDWEAIMAKLKGAIFLTREWFKARERKRMQGGRLINIGSPIGIFGNRGQDIYAAANAGLIAFTRSFSMTIGKWGGTANLIAPGFVDGTDMTKNMTTEEKKQVSTAAALRQMVKPEDIAEEAAHLAHPQGGARITGTVRFVDAGLGGGYTSLQNLYAAGNREVPLYARFLFDEDPTTGIDLTITRDEVKLIKELRDKTQQ